MAFIEYDTHGVEFNNLAVFLIHHIAYSEAIVYQFIITTITLNLRTRLDTTHNTRQLIHIVSVPISIKVSDKIVIAK